MRTTLVIIGLLVVAGATYWTVQTNDASIAPPSGPEQIGPPTQPEPTAEPIPERATTIPTSAAPTSIEPSTASSNKPELAQPPNTPPASFVIHVKHATTKEPISEHRWRFTRPDSVERGVSQTNPTTLSFSKGTTGDLLIEADGMQPFAKKGLVVPATAGPPQTIFAFLSPTANAVGITMVVDDLDRQPITNVRVDAFLITADNRLSAWQLGQPLWSRAASDQDGSYELPPLPNGEYGILLVATDANGNLLPLTPHRQVFTLTGSNGFVEHAQLKPACALRLELFNASGQPFNPDVDGIAQIRLNPVGQTGTERKWTAIGLATHLTNQPTTISQTNSAPGTSPIWLGEPVVAGSYILEISVNGTACVNQRLELRADATQTEQVYIR